MIIINGEDCILGRVATYAAKAALEGEDISLINAGDMIIIGDKNSIISKYRGRIESGTMSKGPFVPRTVNGIVKRAVRGMLRRKTLRGREALKRIKVYEGLPDELRTQQSIVIAKMKLDKPVHRVKIAELSNILKYKRT